MFNYTSIFSFLNFVLLLVLAYCMSLTYYIIFVDVLALFIN